MTWTTSELGSICDITSSRRIFAHEYQTDGVPFFRGKEIVEKFKGAQTVSTELYISRNRFDEIADKHGAPAMGDLLLTSVGTLGVPYLVGPGEEFYFKDGNLTWFRPSKNIDSAFLFYWLISPQGRGELGKSTIGTSQSAYTIELLKRMRISMPSLSAQTAVASILKSYDDLIDNNRRRMALLEDSARQLYREWFVRLRFPGHEHTPIVDGVPQGWSIGTVSDFYETSSGGTPSRKNPEYFTGDIPWVKTQELSNGFITETSEQITDDALKNSSAKLFPTRTVLVALYGATVGELGITAFTAATNQACCAVLKKDPRGHFAHAFLFFRENKDVLVSLSAGAAQKNISQQIVRGVPMLMPAKPLMSMFTEIVGPVFDKILNLQQTNQKLRQARDLLLPRLMNGELAV